MYLYVCTIKTISKILKCAIKAVKITREEFICNMNLKNEKN